MRRPQIVSRMSPCSSSPLSCASSPLRSLSSVSSSPCSATRSSSIFLREALRVVWHRRRLSTCSRCLFLDRAADWRLAMILLARLGSIEGSSRGSGAVAVLLPTRFPTSLAPRAPRPDVEAPAPPRVRRSGALPARVMVRSSEPPGDRYPAMGEVPREVMVLTFPVDLARFIEPPPATAWSGEGVLPGVPPRPSSLGISPGSRTRASRTLCCPSTPAAWPISPWNETRRVGTGGGCIPLADCASRGEISGTTGRMLPPGDMLTGGGFRQGLGREPCLACVACVAAAGISTAAEEASCLALAPPPPHPWRPAGRGPKGIPRSSIPSTLREVEKSCRSGLISSLFSGLGNSMSPNTPTSMSRLKVPDPPPTRGARPSSSSPHIFTGLSSRDIFTREGPVGRRWQGALPPAGSWDAAGGGAAGSGGGERSPKAKGARTQMQCVGSGGKEFSTNHSRSESLSLRSTTAPKSRPRR
mmetsp:Transcript_45834/g.146194  ORF Transcript_45834/g.146194 Transcript_45834/m.146194 type:complete len:471 (-) Transcript_45834:417-1829(-)